MTLKRRIFRSEEYADSERGHQLMQSRIDEWLKKDKSYTVMISVNNRKGWVWFEIYEPSSNLGQCQCGK